MAGGRWTVAILYRVELKYRMMDERRTLVTRYAAKDGRRENKVGIVVQSCGGLNCRRDVNLSDTRKLAGL